MRRTFAPRRLAHAARAALLASTSLGCASTRLQVDEGHPASPASHTAAPAPVGGALDPDYEPARASSAEPAEESGTTVHEHGDHGDAHQQGSAEPQPGADAPSHEHAPATPAPSSNPKEPATLWTCPMHPQIVQSEPGNCPICGMKLKPKEPNGASGAEH